MTLYETAVHQVDIMDALAAYAPHLAGTPPLRVDAETSDIDTLCCAPHAQVFVSDGLAVLLTDERVPHFAVDIGRPSRGRGVSCIRVGF